MEYRTETQLRQELAAVWALLDAERDALRADAERYRWLRNNPQWLGWEHDFRPDEVDREIDAAIDAARATGEHHE